MRRSHGATYSPQPQALHPIIPVIIPPIPRQGIGIPGYARALSRRGTDPGQADNSARLAMPLLHDDKGREYASRMFAYDT